MGSPQAPTIIWQRVVDGAAQRGRWRRLLLWFVAPVAVLVVVFALALDAAAAAGLAVVAGLFGLLLAGWIGVQHLNERSGAIVRFDGAYVLWRQRRVAVDAVESYTTFSSAVSGAGQRAAGTRSQSRLRVALGIVSFRLADGSTVEFVWPGMPAEQLDGVRQALDTVLPGRWQPHAGM